MAIIIPSKCIYDKQNLKVRDNIINRFEVSSVEIVPNNDYEIPVYNEEIECPNDENVAAEADPNGKDKAVGSAVYTDPFSSHGHYAVVSYVEFNSYKKSKDFTIKIPKLKNNSFINKLYYGKDSENNPNIKYSITADVDRGEASSVFQVSVNNFGTSADVTTSEITYGEITNTDSEKVPAPTKETYTYYAIGFEDDIISATAEATFYNSGSILTVTPTDVIENGIEYYKITFNVISGWRTVKIGGGGVVDYSSSDFALAGTYEIYKPTRIEITVYGNTIGIDLIDETVFIPEDKSGNKPFSIEGSEIMQTSNFYETEGNSAIYQGYNSTLSAYKNGKETATILCSISDYYDLNGNKLISINNDIEKMAFEIGDIVIPMVYDSSGNDIYMSKKQDNKPCQFRVCGVRFYYNGAVWQELSLQEI